MNYSKKIFCIVGPTATGKTALAVSLRQLLPSILISADSRQLYRGMDIVTGKDHPEDQKIFCIDLCSPDIDFSVSDWYSQVIKQILNTSALPIIVGGTGLYVKSLIDPPDTLHIPLNPLLRQELDKLSVSELSAMLSILDPHSHSRMNNSDIHNSRRLIRAIEVAKYRKLNNPRAKKTKNNNLDNCIVGLLPPRDQSVYQTTIRARVIERLRLGAIEETKNLLTKYPRTLPSFSAIGYRSIISFLDGKINEEEMISTWVKEEYQYAKRQLLYLRKLQGVIWYESTLSNLSSCVADLLENWYDKEKTK